MRQGLREPKRSKRLAALVACLLLLTSCDMATLTGANPTTPATKAASSATSDPAMIRGKVLGLDGLPAAGIPIRTYLISNNSASLISNNSASLISNNSASYRYGVAAVEDLKTDGHGNFEIPNPQGAVMTLEAVLSSEVKAIAQHIATASPDFALQLAYTGAVHGYVSAPGAPGVKDFTGVDVYIPGTSYLARTDLAGRYTLTNVAPGTFNLIASRPGLGSASATGITVRSKITTSVGDLNLQVTPPSLSGLSADNGGPGSTVIVQGDHFGASTGDSFHVTLGGLIITAPQRLDDRTLSFEVPAGAPSGDLVLTVSGLDSNPLSFKVLKSLSFQQGGWDLILLKGASRPFSVLAYDTAGSLVATPSLRWSVSNDVASVSASGSVTGLAAGYGDLTVSSGALSASLPINVLERYPMVSTFAGSGNQGYQDGPPTTAQFTRPFGIAIDLDDNLYVSEFSQDRPTSAQFDLSNHRIRKITPQGDVSTYAGTGARGNLDAPSGPATSAQFYGLTGMIVTATRDLYVADYGNRLVRRITASGSVTTCSGNGALGGNDHHTGVTAVTRDAQHNLYIVDADYPRIRKVTPDGQISTFAGTGVPGYRNGPRETAQFNSPGGLAFDVNGNMFVTDTYNHCVRKIAPDGTISTVAGNGTPGYVDGNAAKSRLNKPDSLIVDALGNVYVTDSGNLMIRKISTTGMVTTVAGNGTRGSRNGEGPQSRFYSPQDLVIDSHGNLYVTDQAAGMIRKIAF